MKVFSFHLYVRLFIKIQTDNTYGLVMGISSLFSEPDHLALHSSFGSQMALHFTTYTF